MKIFVIEEKPELHDGLATLMNVITGEVVQKIVLMQFVFER